MNAPYGPRRAIPSDLSEVPDDEIRQIVGSWTYRGTIVSFDDVIGHPAQVASLRRLAAVLHLSSSDPQRLARMGIRTGGRGAILSGPPGTGKTYAARALASAAGPDRAIYVFPSGEATAELIDRAYSVLNDQPPCVVLIDEADRLIAQDWAGGDAALRAALLGVLDGLDRPGTGPMTIAITSLPLSRVQEAMLRPSRLSPGLEFGLPTRADRRVMWAREIARRPAADGIDVDVLAEKSDTWSGSEIEGGVEEASVRAVVGIMDGSSTSSEYAVNPMAEDSLTMDGLLDVVASRFRHVDPGVELPPDYVVGVHEAGHAIAQAIASSPEHITEVRLYGRGHGRVSAVHGVEHLDQLEDISPGSHARLSAADVRAALVTSVAGIAAESLFFGSGTTGNGEDQANATSLARLLVDLEANYSVDSIERASGEYPVGSEIMRQERFRSIERITVDARHEADRLVGLHHVAIDHFAEALLKANDYTLTGVALHVALREALRSTAEPSDEL